MSRNRAFTLAELVMLLAMIVVSLPITVASLSCARKGGFRRMCTSNMNTIGKAMALYVGDEDDKTPRLADDAHPVSGALNGRTYDNIFPEAAGQPDNSAEMAKVAMQNVWLMIRKGSVTEGAFHCPSDSAWKNRGDYDSEPEKYGWRYKSDFSFGMHWPYEQTGGKQNPAALNVQLDGGVVIFADQNPATLEGSRHGKAVSSRDPVVAPSNHPKEGEAILHMDNSTRFYKVLDEDNDRPKDSRAGYKGDEIYEPKWGDMPTTEFDTYIVPTIGR